MQKIKGIVKDKSLKRQVIRCDADEEFVVAFKIIVCKNKEINKSEDMNQNNVYFCDKLDFMMDLFTCRNDNDDDESLRSKNGDGDISIGLNDRTVGFGTADKFVVYELLELARETDDCNKRKIETAQQQLKEIKDVCVGKTTKPMHECSIFCTFKNDRNFFAYLLD